MAFEFPRIMQKGRLAGQHFETRQAYIDALKASSPKRRKTRKRRQKRVDIPLPLQERNAQDPDVAKIVEAYDELRAEGIGQAKAVRLIERLVLGR